MSFITVSGVLTNALGVILPNTVLKFSAIRTSQKVLNSISIEVETNESGAYNFPLMFGVYSLAIRPKNEAAFKPVASNIVVINTNQSGTLNSLIYNQQILQEVDEELINEMLGIKHATEVAATSAAISASNASTSATDALASKNAAAISENNAAASANAASSSAAQALASKNAAATSEAGAAASASNALTSENEALGSASLAATSASLAATSAAEALASKNAAAISETNADTSEASALAYKNAAAISETNSASSAASALASKNAAASSEANAATSAYNALNYANISVDSANSASASATNATNSAASALASKNSAAISETNSATSAAQALASKNAAAASEVNAANSAAGALNASDAAHASELSAYNNASSALNSKNAAATSEANADISEATALAYANAANNAASSATDSANNAASSASSALASKNAAEAAKVAAENAAATLTGAMVEAGAVDMSSGNYPAPLKDSNNNFLATFWKVTVAGVASVDSVYYGVGDSVVYSNTLNAYYKIDNTESVTSVNGKQGVVNLNASEVGALPATGGNLTGPLGLKTIQGQGSSVEWASLDVAGIKGGYAGINFTSAGHWFGVQPSGLSGVWNSAGNSKWYFTENGVLAGGATVPWSIITNHPSRTNWANTGALHVVAGQLAWTYHSNGHAIFDASVGTSPEGTVIDKVNSQVAWATSYPTLMGWNGTNTYGVRVDSARLADGAITADRITGTVSTDGQDLKIHGKRAMVGDNGANALHINYGNDWGVTRFSGNVDGIGALSAARVITYADNTSDYSNANFEARVNNGSTQTPRISLHRPGICAAAFRLDYDNTVVLETANPGALGSFVANHVYSNAGNTGAVNELTRTDYVLAQVNSSDAFRFRGTKADANASLGLGSYYWHPSVTNSPIGNTFAHGLQFGGPVYGDSSWVSDITFIHGQGLYHRATVNGGFAGWTKFAWAQEVNYTATPTQYRSTSSWIGLVSGVNGADAVVMGTNSGAATIGAHSNGLDAWAPLYINCHPNGGITAPLVLSTPKVKLPNDNTLYDVWHSGNFDPNSKLNTTGGTVSGQVYNSVNGVPNTFVGGKISSESGTLSLDANSFAFVTSPLDVHLCFNSRYQPSVGWVKYDNNKPSGKIVINEGGLQYVRSDAGASDTNQYAYNIYHIGNLNPIEKNTGNVLNNSSFGVGFLSSGDSGPQWISGYFGKNGGASQVVIGESSGMAVIGGHTAAKTAWAPLLIGMSPNGPGNEITYISRPYAVPAGSNVAQEILHRGIFDPDSKLSNNGSGGTLYLNNWFRSTGNSGWYNETYAGGWYMDEASTIKVHNGKRIFTSNDENYALGAEGSIFSNRRMWVDTRKVIGNGGSYNAWRYGDAPFHAGMGGLNVNSFAPIVGSSNYTNGHGYSTRVQFGVVTPGGTGWSNAVIMVGSAESDAQPLAVYSFGADGHLSGLGAITLSGNANIGNDMSCAYAYANGAQPQVPNALTRKDYVDAQCSSYRWDNRQVIQHGGGDANAHYNSEWDGASVANAPSADWHFFREMYHSGGANWRHQEAFNFFTDEEWFRRGFNASDYTGWVRRWNSSNFNPDSKANLSGANFTGNITAPGITVSSQIVVNNASTDSIISTGGIHVSAGLFAGTTVTGTAGVFDGVKRVFSDNNHPNFAFDRNPTTTVLWTGSSSSHPTTITLPEALGNFNRVRFEGVNAGASIAWVVTMSVSELAAICNTGLLVYIASGTYSYTFNSFTTASTTLSRNTSVNGYLTKIVGIR